jgi:hypothetical protein
VDGPDLSSLRGGGGSLIRPLCRMNKEEQNHYFEAYLYCRGMRIAKYYSPGGSRLREWPRDFVEGIPP